MARAKKRAPAKQEPPAWARLHLWQIQPLRDVLVALSILGLFILGARISIVTIPLLLAVLFAYLFEPVVRKMLRTGRVTRKAAVIVILVCAVVLLVVPIVIGATFGIVQGVQLVTDIGQKTTAVVYSVDDPGNEELNRELGDGAWMDIRDTIISIREQARTAPQEPSSPPGEVQTAPSRPVRFLGVDTRVIAQVVEEALTWLRENLDTIGKRALTTGKGAVEIALTVVGSFGSLVFGAFLTAFFFFFLSSSWGSFKQFSLDQIPDEDRERSVAILRKMDIAISGFVRGRLTIAFFLAGFYTIGFWLIGCPAPLVLGPMIATLAIVPYASVLGLPVVIVLLWLEPHTGIRDAYWWAILAPIVIYQVGQAFDDYILTPKVQGDATGLDTPTILFASIAGGSLMGFYGLLTAIPLAACLKILVVEVFVPHYQAWLKGEEKDFLPLDRD